MIKILCVGKIKESYLNELIADYQKRVNKFHKLEIIEIKDNENILKETNALLKHIDCNNYLIGLDIKGNKLNSIEFSNKINDTFIKNSNITFIIGGSNGLSNEVKTKCHYLLSFSSLTFPHGLFRGILLEQLYRAFKILNNETYHK